MFQRAYTLPHGVSGNTIDFGSIVHGSNPCEATKREGNENMIHCIDDNAEKARAFISVEEDTGALVFQVKVTETDKQYDFVISAEDLKLIDFMRKRSKRE